MDIGILHFIRPYWLLGLPLAWLALFVMHRSLAAEGDWAKICDPHLLGWLSQSEDGSRRRNIEVLLAVALSIALLALSGPSWVQLPYPSLNARLPTLCVRVRRTKGLTNIRQ